MDLHLHSTHSDGTQKIEQILQMAKDLGLDYISITDHDTIKGVFEAIQLAPKYNINIIPGVEINTEYKKKEVHILGYFIDINNTKLSDTLELLREGRVGRVKRIVEKLQNLDIKVSYEDVLLEGKGESIGRPHVALAMIKKGYGKTVSEIFDKYIDIGKPAYVERFKLTPYEAISVIRESGGIAVLAHPRLVNSEEVVDELLPHIDGLEVYHSENSIEDMIVYEELADEHNLIITGGSDCHGEGKNKCFLMGTVDIPENIKSKLVNMFEERCK